MTVYVVYMWDDVRAVVSSRSEAEDIVREMGNGWGFVEMKVDDTSGI